MGFELVDIEYLSQYGKWVLRIYADKEGGITLDECARVSREIGNLMDVKDVFPHEYVLEVSSPGLDRPLVKPEHFEQFTGELVKIRSTEAVLGRKNFKGILESFDGEYLYVAVDNEVYEIPFDIVEKANLVPMLDS